MEDTILCVNCAQNPATKKCSQCDISLCDECIKKIRLKSGDMASQSLGFGISSGSSLSTLRPGEKIKYLCKKCYRELDTDMI